MVKNKKRVFAGIYMLLVLVFLLLMGGLVSDLKAGDCIYAEYRLPIFGCVGATTRLCQGPPDCPTFDRLLVLIYQESAQILSNNSIMSVSKKIKFMMIIMFPIIGATMIFFLLLAISEFFKQNR